MSVGVQVAKQAATQATRLLILCVALYSATAEAAVALPVVNARAWILYDPGSEQVLAQHNADQRLEPASLTKLMGAYLVFKALHERRLDHRQQIEPSANAAVPNGAAMHLEAGKPVSVDDLMLGMLVVSANDATLALAETLGGSEAGFVSQMNQEAQRMGLANTHFRNATGHSTPEHYSSARDLARLAGAIVRSYPEEYSLFSRHEIRYRDFSQLNRNRLLWLDTTVDGMKTGQTEAAGWCLVASALREPRRLIVVILGAASDNERFAAAQRLLNYGYQAFDTVRLHQGRQVLKSLPVWLGKAPSVEIGLREDLILSVPAGRAAGLTERLRYHDALRAPLRAGDSAGSLLVSLDGQQLGEYPVQVLHDVPAAGWLGRSWDRLRLWLKNF